MARPFIPSWYKIKKWLMLSDISFLQNLNIFYGITAEILHTIPRHS
jgi:hypothetical protein